MKGLPRKKVVYGQVGTLVEELQPNIFEVEFTNKHGETISSFAVKSDELLLLHFEMELY
ncbi:DUF4926 domain-containing protein [Parasediminibacterium sp. JCM 36343]|uniref:DUF4926 domain-containing protein n=1 Tax=Parasediminibacterium sp. JCM 36343 TaxID=3374279 RepID=UPI00397D5C06